MLDSKYYTPFFHVHGRCAVLYAYDKYKNLVFPNSTSSFQYKWEGTNKPMYHAAALVAENKVFRVINENRVGSTKFSKLEDFLEAIHVEGVNGVIVR